MSNGIGISREINRFSFRNAISKACKEENVCQLKRIAVGSY